jgi:hypothetical protein
MSRKRRFELESSITDDLISVNEFWIQIRKKSLLRFQVEENRCGPKERLSVVVEGLWKDVPVIRHKPTLSACPL